MHLRFRLPEDVGSVTILVYRRSLVRKLNDYCAQHNATMRPITSTFSDNRLHLVVNFNRASDYSLFALWWNPEWNLFATFELCEDAY